jgi:hypothetical protein
MIAYYTHDVIGLTVPILHRAYYSSDEDYYTVNKWCAENCKGRFYFSPAYMRESVEFEDDEDAMMFILRWS